MDAHGERPRNGRTKDVGNTVKTNYGYDPNRAEFKGAQEYKASNPNATLKKAGYSSMSSNKRQT